MTSDPSSSVQPSDTDLPEDERYLVFVMGGELFASPLLDVTEVIEATTPKPLPNTVDHFLGVVNVRGKIFGVVDLQIRFGMPRPEGSVRATYLLFNSASSGFALAVDRVVAVSRIPSAEIERKPDISTKVPLAFLAGIAKVGPKLVTVVRMRALLDAEAILTYRRSAFGA